MTCAHCAELQEELVWLRGELGMQTNGAEVASITRAFKVRPQTARLLLMLHAAKGRPVPSAQMMDRLPGKDERSDTNHYPSVIVFHARKAIGSALIENLHGVGYRLTTEGLAKITEALGLKVAA